jgi:outer membrane lipoprotein LolB
MNVRIEAKISGGKAMNLRKELASLKYTALASVCMLVACAPPKATIEPTLPSSSTSQIANENPITNEKTASAVSIKQAHPTLKANNVSAWELSGAIAAKSQRKGWSASLNWLQQGPNQYQIRLFGPLGGGTVMVEKQGGVITYRDGPKKMTSSNADQLLREQTGIQLPVNNLYYWVRGVPAPGGVQSAQHDAANHLTTLKQSGYIIEYANYTSADGLDLPSKIRLQGHGTVIKLIIKHWRV